MGRPFNFLQFAETGKVSAYSGHFKFFYTPSGMIRSPDSFIVEFDADAYQSKAFLDISIRPELKPATPDNFNWDTTFSGSLYPVFKESGVFEFKITGNVPSDNIDRPVFIASFTGDYKQDNKDSPQFISSFTGSKIKHALDIPTLQFNLTGGFPIIYREASQTQVVVSGKISKSERDNLLLDIEVSSIDFSLGYVKETGDFVENTSLDIDIDQIFWSRAG